MTNIKCFGGVMGKKDSTFTGISKKAKTTPIPRPSIRSVEEALASKPTPKPTPKPTVEPTVEPTIKLQEDKFYEEMKANGVDVEKEIREPLPSIDIPADSREVQKALMGLITLMDTVYFSLRNQPMCTKKFEKVCIMNCQHFGFCRVKSGIKENIRKI